MCLLVEVVCWSYIVCGVWSDKDWIYIIMVEIGRGLEY